MPKSAKKCALYLAPLYTVKTGPEDVFEKVFTEDVFAPKDSRCKTLFPRKMLYIRVSGKKISKTRLPVFALEKIRRKTSNGSLQDHDKSLSKSKEGEASNRIQRDGIFV